MESRILDVNKPIVASYTSYGALFSILPDSMLPWIYNNFIQIRYAKGWNILAFDNHRMFLSNCPFISFYILPKIYLNNNYNGSLIKIIKDAIDNDQYLFLYIDRYYLPNNIYYLKDHFDHEIFIYGYDLQQGIVYVADNLNNGKFTFTTCPISSLESGYHNINGKYDFLTDIRFIKVNKEVNVELNLEQIIDGLQRFIYSEKTYDIMYEQECEFGISIMEKEYHMYDKDNNFIDQRWFHLLYEHSLLMEMRVEYLIKNKYITNDEVNLQKFIVLRNEYTKLRNLSIKFNIAKRADILKHIQEELVSVVDSQKIIYENLLNKLVALCK